MRTVNPSKPTTAWDKEISSHFYLHSFLCQANSSSSTNYTPRSIDDRNYRGNYKDILATYHTIAEYDLLAGHLTQPTKNAMAATHQHDTDKIRKLSLDGETVKLKQHDVLVGDTTNANRRHCNRNANDRADEAYHMTIRVNRLAISRKQRYRGMTGGVIPKM